MRGEHTIVEFAGGRRLPGEPDEIADVIARLGNVTRRVVGIDRTMSDDDGAGMEVLDLLNGREPIEQALMVRFDQVGMRSIVDGVARDHQADRGHVQAGRVVGIGVADIDRDDLVAFKVERSAFQPFGGDEFRGD